MTEEHKSPYKYIEKVAKIDSRFYFRFSKVNEKSIYDLSALKLLGYPDITYGGVKPTKDNVSIAIHKYDAPFIHPAGRTPTEVLQTKDPMWILAEKYTIDYLSTYIPITKPKVEDMYMNFSSSPGWPYSIYFKSKAEVPDYMINLDILDMDYPAFWKLGPKTERLPIFDIKNDNKIRTFMIPPMQLLVTQKIFCEDFNKAMKDVPWSAMGFNWHEGGFNELISTLSKHFHKSDWDVKKWDKRNPLKASCYRIRRKFLDLTEIQEKMYWQMASDEIEPLVILEDGGVYKFQIGQPSGSENTTSDNTLGHIALFMYRCITNCLKIYSRIPTLREILLNVSAKIYGDDVITSHSQDYYFISDPESLKYDYSLFGFEIDPDDPQKYKKQLVLTGLRFLGFEVDVLDDQYVPFYNYDKVVNSSIVTLERTTAKEQLIRFEALLSLLVFNPNYEKYRTFVKDYSKYHSLEVPLLLSQQRAQCKEMGKD